MSGLFGIPRQVERCPRSPQVWTALRLLSASILIGFCVLLSCPARLAAQCVSVGPDQTCTNADNISGPLNAGGASGSPGIASGANGTNGGNATVNNTGTVNPLGATAIGGDGGAGQGNASGSGGTGGDGGNATLTNAGNVAGAVTATGGRGGVGGGSSGGGKAGDGGRGGFAAVTNSGSIAGSVAIAGGFGGFSMGVTYPYGVNGQPGTGGSALLMNSGVIAGSVTLTGGGGAPVPNTWQRTVAPQGGEGGEATVFNSGTIAGAVSVTAGRGGNVGDVSHSPGGVGGDGGNATLINTGYVGGLATVQGGPGNLGGLGLVYRGGIGGVGGQATLNNSGVLAGGANVVGGGGGEGGGSDPFVGNHLNGNGGAGGNAVLGNWGRIAGDVSIAGGAGGFALFGSAGGADGTATLNVYAGSRIAGSITLSGSAKYLNFFGGNYSYTLNSLSDVAISSASAPFVVSGNTVVVIDPTIFSANARALIDFSRSASDAVPVFAGSAPGGAAPLAFAGTDTPSRFDDAFAAVSGLASAYAGDAMVFKAPTASYADGTTVWARGFAGQRVQQQDGTQLRNTSLFYGGMMGADFVVRPDLRTGIYVGGGNTKSAIDLNQGSSADLVFGGAYARYDVGQSFLHAAVQAGGSRNTVNRTINNNLAVNGQETATGSFNGWYVSPEATFGRRWALGQLADASYTMTPSLRLRYLYGSYGGYTETGTAAPLTMGSQIVNALEERGEMKLTRSVSFTASEMLSASISAGLLGTQRMGGTTVDAVLLGQAIPFATTGQANIWGGFGGLGLEWRSRNVTLFSAAEYLALSDRSNVASGRAGLRVAF